MKLLIALVVLISFIAYPQADLMIHFLMYDNAAPPNNGSCDLIFGLDSTATDGIDEQLGEYPVPPDACCGWGGPVLCAQFILPDDPNTTQVDYRFGELPFTGIKVHNITYCSDTSSTIVTIRCSLPAGTTAVLEDFLGGIFIHIVMVDSNEYHIYDPYIGLDFPLRLTVNYNNVVPVEIRSFNGIYLNSSAQLNWTTETENNDRGFEIERQIDKKKYEVSNQWKKIGYVTGHGTTTEPEDYSFTDENPVSGINKYRLKQIDFDGSVKYSNEIEVEVNIIPKEFALEQNFPNPFNPSTVIEFSLPEDVENINLSIYNVLGEKVAELVNGDMLAGKYQYQWNSKNFASGIYIYEIRTDKFSASKKMSLLK